ncbi:hypothetical protein Tco_1051799, partial [Tanacetum coccineum]
MIKIMARLSGVATKLPLYLEGTLHVVHICVESDRIGFWYFKNRYESFPTSDLLMNVCSLNNDHLRLWIVQNGRNGVVCYGRVVKAKVWAFLLGVIISDVSCVLFRYDGIEWCVKVGCLRKRHGRLLLGVIVLVSPEVWPRINPFMLNFESPRLFSTKIYYMDLDSGKQKEIKAYTFYRMESEEVYEKYITPCYVEGLDAFYGVTDLEYDTNLISNEFVVKLGLTYEVVKNRDKVIDRKLLISLKGELPFLKLAKANVDFGSGILTIWSEAMIVDSNDDGLDALLAINHPKTQEELTREELEADIYEQILLLNDRRPIIETLKYSDKHKKLLDNILLDKLKLDGELKGDQERLGEEVVREYRVLKEKEDPGGKAKPKIDKVRMLDHSNRYVPLIGKRSFMYTCGAIIGTIKGRMTTFDGNVHQQFKIVKVRNSQENNDSDNNDEEYSLKGDETGKPFNGPHQPQYMDSEDVMDHALAEQDYLDPFRNV